MTPGARVAAAIKILDECLLGQSENKVLLNWFRRNRFAGSKDRREIRDLLFQCLRFKLSCHWPFKQVGFPENGRVIVLGLLKLTNQSFEKIFDSRKYSPSDLSQLEKIVLKNFHKTLSLAPTFVQLNFPQFLESSLRKTFGDAFRENLMSLNGEANLFIRVNRIKCDSRTVFNSLYKEGIPLETVPQCQDSFQVKHNKNKLNRSQTYLAGKFEIQDISSQAVVKFIKPRKNTKILDFCAGAGGKTLAIASLTQGDAKYFVHDVNTAKLKNLQMRCRRSGVQPNTFMSNINEGFDLVVLDVPCSGSGVWKRNPGDKWRITKERLSLILSEQKGILNEASKYVVENGTLAYVTCSVLKNENQDQIAWFLKENLNFSFLRETFFSPLDGGDGFYVSLLIKNH